MSVTAARVVGAADGKAGFLGSIGVRFMIDGAEAGDRFSVVEHPMSPWALAAPLHRHHNEDEYSFVIEGRMGALLGDDHVEAGPGDLVHKPRGQWHTFWNAGDDPCKSSRSSPQQASNASSLSSSTSAASPWPDPTSSGNSASGSRWRWTPAACPISSSASESASQQNRSPSERARASPSLRCLRGPLARPDLPQPQTNTARNRVPTSTGGRAETC